MGGQMIASAPSAALDKHHRFDVDLIGPFIRFSVFTRWVLSSASHDVSSVSRYCSLFSCWYRLRT